ncbi:hypothetical protein [Clostridium perfringens]|uniref:hypothetical protein n=1 Tax=Clostridium perfringens TaxID=1502 RepID=UPI00123FA9A5|nr:hypothetical protein [Clostridium perfringens]
MAYKAVRSNSRKFRICNERLNQFKDKLEREKVIDFAIAASTLAFHVENLLEEYKYSGKLTDNQLIKMQHRIRVLRDNEEEFKKVLGID